MADDAELLATWISAGEVERVKRCLPGVADLLELATAGPENTNGKDYEVICQWVDLVSREAGVTPGPPGDPQAVALLRGAAIDAAGRLAESCFRA